MSLDMLKPRLSGFFIVGHCEFEHYVQGIMN
jgi:hypothetical protein